MATKLDKDTTKPSTTEPGDGPADTTDPTESAQSVPAQPGDEAQKVGTVNAVKPEPTKRISSSSSGGRTEKYKATKPNGSEVTVTRNIDTGESKVS